MFRRKGRCETSLFFVLSLHSVDFVVYLQKSNQTVSMNITKSVHSFMLIAAFLFYGCTQQKTANTLLHEYPKIFPDYHEVVIPPNIAPLNFMVEGVDEIFVEFHLDGKCCFSISCQDGIADIPMDKWTDMLGKARGKEIEIHVSTWGKEHPEGVKYLPFKVMVADEDIDNWITYRLIEPGYQSWKQLGIYQRDIRSFDEKVIVDNHTNTQTCLNCHSFANYSPNRMMFHARGANGGTYIYKDGKLLKVNIEKIGLKKGASYPIWHPEGKLIAFSSNKTQQAFFDVGEQPLEVYDESSDLIFYDTETGEVFSDPRFLTSETMETYPAWSPDGKWLYYSLAEAKSLPKEHRDMHYHLCRLSFDPSTRTFGEKVDTLYNASMHQGSASYPRISPDGQYLLYTWASHGTFPIWHKEADLKMMDLENRVPLDVSVWNSEEADSYHAWSSNGRWIVFGSRRLDGRYTRLFIAYLDKSGKACRPFLLPQEDPRHHIWRMKSFNIPEFVKESVELPSTDFSLMAQ